MDAPVQGYSGYLSPHVDRILAMHRDGADTRAIAAALYQLGARAEHDRAPTFCRMQRTHHISNLRLMVLHVLQRQGLRVRRRRLAALAETVSSGRD